MVSDSDIICKLEIQQIFRLTRIQLSFWKAQVHHSMQSAISHTNTKVNKYTLNSYLLMSVQTKHQIGPNF